MFVLSPSQPSFERLVKRKWLTNTEPYDQIEFLIKEYFKKYHRMDSPPYQVLVLCTCMLYSYVQFI